MHTSNENEETPNAMPKYKSILSLIAVLAFMALFYTVLLREFHQVAETKVSNPGIETISKETELRFPKNARLLHSFKTQQLSKSQMYAEIEMKSSEVSGFIDSLPGKPPVNEGDGLTNARRIINQSTPPDWWKPGAAKQPIGGVIRADEHEFALVIGNKGSGNSVVYICRI